MAMSGASRSASTIRWVLWMTLLAIFSNSREISARPASHDDYLTVEGDLATVGSLRREVRQPAPQRFATEVDDLLSSNNAPLIKRDDKKHRKNASGRTDEGGYYKTYGSDADGEKGYLKKSYSKGDHGYKTLDTFHKKLGDRYGFEEHEAFGKASGKNDEQQHGKSASYKSKPSVDHDEAGTETHYAEDEGEHSEYSEGDEGDHYSADDADGYGESYSSGGGDEYGSRETYSSGGESSAEGSDGYSYY